MKVSQLKLNPQNPRKIAADQLDRLMRSISSFPEMMRLRPIVYDPETMHVLGGNQRLAAIRKLGVPDPVMTECIADGNHVDISHYNLTPKAIIDALGLRDIDYEKTAEWGHFGIGMPWDG